MTSQMLLVTDGLVDSVSQFRGDPFGPRPGHLLTELIDVISKTHKEIAGNSKALRALLHTATYRGIKFIGPRGRRIDHDTPMIASDLRPPYPVTVLEGYAFSGDAVSSLIIARDTGDHVELNFMCHSSSAVLAAVPDLSEWVIAPVTCCIAYDDTPLVRRFEAKLKPFLAHPMTTHGGEAAESYEAFLHYYVAVCQLLANHHVETQDIEPDAKAARWRRLRGKAPLFTYKTLVIGEAKRRGHGTRGGTHASPRSHLRRGFYRTSKNGVRHWVSATMVKGDTPGFVHKDYQITQQGD